MVETSANPTQNQAFVGGTQEVKKTGLLGSVEQGLTGQPLQTGYQQPLTSQPLQTGYQQPLQSGFQQPLTGQTGYQQPLQTGYQQPLTGTTGYGPTTSTTGSTGGGTLHKLGEKLKGALGGSSTTTGTGYQQPLQTGYQQPLTGQPLQTGFVEQRPIQTGFVEREETGFIAPTTTEFVQTEVIRERPVLDRVEKIVHTEVVEKPRIIEEHEQELIEVHEQPIEKRILHPTTEFHVREQNIYESTGLESANLERERLLEQMRLQDRSHRVDVEEFQDVRVTQHAPQVYMGKELRKEIIQKPIVTEIHEQPVIEVHEQEIHKTVYEKPIVTVVRETPIVESTVTASEPLTGITTGMHHMHIAPQPIIQEVVREVPVVQREILQPVTVSTTVVEKEHGLPPRVKEDTLGTTRKL